MDFEFWWLLALFPVFFVLGFLAARIDQRSVVSDAKALPERVFDGVRYLLKDEPTRAIDAFAEVAAQDERATSLRFALGSLYRRKGELDKAIRMHLAVLEQNGLADDERLDARLELAEDYLKAGLLDRSETHLQHLLGTVRHAEASTMLLAIYQQERDWPKAIDAAARLEVTSPDDQRDLAQFHCELANTALLSGDTDTAQRHVEEALGVNRRCTRATMLQGEIALLRGEVEQAIHVWRRIEGQNPPYVALVAAKLQAAYDKVGRAAEGMNWLTDYLQRYPSIDVLDVVYQAHQDLHGDEQAYYFLREILRTQPSLLGIRRLLEAQVSHATPERRGDVELMRQLIFHHTQQLAAYQCGQCGFHARAYHWQCPACAAWESFPPRRVEELELVH